MANLNPCECGGEAEHVKIWETKRQHCFIRCKKCGRETKVYTTKQNAVKAWNGEWHLSRFLLCPVCGEKTEVLDSRSDCESVKRKRKCLECGYRFYTVEIDEDLYKKISKEEC